MPVDGGPPRSPGDAPAVELGDAPPFLSWTGIYLIVLGVLAAQVAVYAALTAIYR
jgi:hypothetical protein